MQQRDNCQRHDSRQHVTKRRGKRRRTYVCVWAMTHGRWSERPLTRNFRGDREGQELAGLRPSCPAAATSTTRLHFRLLGNLQRIVDLDPEVSDRAFQFAVTEQ